MGGRAAQGSHRQKKASSRNPPATLREDVEEAEGHDVHLVAGEGPGGSREGGWGAGHSRATAGRGGRADSTQGTSEHKRTKPHCLGAHKPANPNPETLELQEGGFKGGRQRRAFLTSDLAASEPLACQPQPRTSVAPGVPSPSVRAVCVFAAFLT